MTDVRVLQINLNATSAVIAEKHCANVEIFANDCAYCIDAPTWYPAGSTVVLQRLTELIPTMSTRIWRDTE